MESMRNIPCDKVNKLKEIFSDAIESENVSCADENFIFQFHSALIENIRIQEFNKRGEAFAKEDFANVANKAASYFKGLVILYEGINELSEFVTWKSDFCKALVLDSIVISQFFHKNLFWSDDSCSISSYKVLKFTLRFFKCRNLGEYFYGKKDSSDDIFTKLFPNGVLKFLLEEMVKTYNQNTWKNYPSYIQSYSWMLYNTVNPHLTNYVGYFLPAALCMLDDWEQEHKYNGIKALIHIIRFVPSSELRLYCRAHVIFDALNHNLFTRDCLILSAAYPAAIVAATSLEKCPKTAKTMEKEYYDILMDRLLGEMMHEQNLQMRFIYVENLEFLVREMKIFAVKWCDLILQVCSNYLEAYEGENARDRILILKTLEVFIKNCWPRLKLRIEQILKMLLKLTYEMNLKLSFVTNKDEVLLKVKGICNLLSAVDPITTKRLCKELETLDINYKKDILFVIGDIIV